MNRLQNNFKSLSGLVKLLAQLFCSFQSYHIILISRYFTSTSLIQNVWLITHVSLDLAHVVKEETHFLVSLPTLSNQERELHKEAVLSACEQAEIANCKADRKLGKTRKTFKGALTFCQISFQLLD